MVHRTRAKVNSSLQAAAFQVVQAHDPRGLAYRVRKDIPTGRRLSQSPLAAPAPRPRGRPRGLRDILTVT